MFDDAEIADEFFAYIPEMGKVIKYNEALSLELQDKYHDEICKHRKFVGLGYIMGYNIYGELYSFDELSLIYI